MSVISMLKRSVPDVIQGISDGVSGHTLVMRAITVTRRVFFFFQILAVTY